MIANNVTTTNFDSKHGDLEDIDIENARANNVTTTNFDSRHGYIGRPFDVKDMRADDVVNVTTKTLIQDC